MRLLRRISTRCQFGGNALLASFRVARYHDTTATARDDDASSAFLLLICVHCELKTYLPYLLTYMCQLVKYFSIHSFFNSVTKNQPAKVSTFPSRAAASGYLLSVRRRGGIRSE